LQTINVLLVEDNPQDIFLVKAVLEEYEIPHALHVIEDGQDAIDFVETMGKHDDAPRPDLILLDINLPGASGLEVLSCIRKHPEGAITPVIVLSSVALMEQERLAELNVSRFFQKSANFDGFAQLVSVVREALNGCPQLGSLAATCEGL
jgi:CheY-like chemotaxis protein